MTSTAITAPGLSGILRMTWVQDDLAHVLERAETDEPPGTWTGLACPDHQLSLGGDVDNATLRHLAADSKLADLVWEAPDELAAEHCQAFQAAIQAYDAGASESAEQSWHELEAIWSRAAADRGNHDVLTAQTAALGHRLFRAPLRPSRPSPPARP